MFYKIIKDKKIIGVCTSDDLRMYQQKHNLLLACNEDMAQYISCNDILYRDDWFKDTTCNIEWIYAEVIIIEEEEYNALCEMFKINEALPLIEEEQLREDFEDEKPVVDDNTLEGVIEAKIYQMSIACRKAIIRGFDLELSDGNIHHFSLTMQDQINMQMLYITSRESEDLIPYHADGEKGLYFSKREFENIVSCANYYKEYHQAYFNSLKGYIKDLKNIIAVGKIEYGTEIPAQYQSDVLKVLIARNNH